MNQSRTLPGLVSNCTHGLCWPWIRIPTFPSHTSSQGIISISVTLCIKGWRLWGRQSGRDTPSHPPNICRVLKFQRGLFFFVWVFFFDIHVETGKYYFQPSKYCPLVAKRENWATGSLTLWTRVDFLVCFSLRSCFQSTIVSSGSPAPHIGHIIVFVVRFWVGAHRWIKLVLIVIAWSEILRKSTFFFTLFFSC